VLIAADSVGWPSVGLALVAALPSIIGAIYAGRVHRAVRTPSGTAIGTQVEQTQHVALGNNYRLQVLSGEADGPEVTAARKIEAHDVPDAPPLERRTDPHV
jgi:hypothetical protein